jgi:hypothetical protein
MIYEDALSAVRRYVAEAFKAGTAIFFPHYTLHGAEHLEELDRLALLMQARVVRSQLPVTSIHGT